MIGWNSALNWTWTDVMNAVMQARGRGRIDVSLDVEHSDYQNELDIVKWCEEMGHSAEIKGERIYVTFGGNK